MNISTRIASMDDIPAIERIIERAIIDLQQSFLSPEEIAVSRLFMGIDTQLLRDGTYFCAMIDGRIAGIGGWSWRRTLYGGEHAGDLIDPEPLDPRCEPARIRAMYTDPEFVRRGVGMAIITAAEDAARSSGFLAAELMSTLAGEPLYRSCGYIAEGDRVFYTAGSASVPLILMRKRLVTSVAV
jgi:GNAT superfamily N-acetyltransferase